MTRCSYVCLLLIHQAVLNVVCRGEGIDCEVMPPFVSLLQTGEMISLTADDHIAVVVEGRNETPRSAHIDGNFSEEAMHHRKRNTANLALIASSLHVGTYHISMDGVLHRVTLFSCVALAVVCLSLLMHAPHLIRTLWQARQAADEAIMRPDDPLEISSASRVSGFAYAPIVLWGTVYILVSMALINYNKWLMTPGRFPFAVNLTLCHQCSGSLLMFVMYKVKPGLFPSLDDPVRDKTLSRSTLLGGLLPVALCFGGQLVLSNSAYTYASVAFLQMMKEGNLVLVYFLSLLVGLEVFQGLRAQVLFCLLISTSLTIQGEMFFSKTAFIVQGSSQMMEATKLVLQGLLLSTATTGSTRLDPYTYNLLAQPMVASLLFVFLFVCLAWIPGVPTASMADLMVWWPHLLVNCCVALSLNVTVANFFASASPMSFIVCGILKDVVIICVDVVISGTQISGLQVVAFILQLTFVACYSLLKIFQKELEGTTTPPKKMVP